MFRLIYVKKKEKKASDIMFYPIPFMINNKLCLDS